MSKSPRIHQVDLDAIAKKKFVRYATAVNEDRAFPNNIDGLKPVMRRGLWTVKKDGSTAKGRFKKLGNYVGITYANYHPHGDSAVINAFVNMRNMPMPLVEGSGNWGTLTNPTPGAPRYIEMRMSQYSEAVFFDPFYEETIDFVPNYDDSKKEPLILPTLLPNILINSTEGIGVGTRANMPTFTLKSVVKVVKAALASKDKQVSTEMLKKLQFTTLYEGVPEYNKSEYKRIFLKGRGSVVFRSSYVVNPKNKSVEIEKFAVYNIANPIDRCAIDSEVVKVNNISDTADKHGRVFIQLKKNLAGKKLDNAAKRIVEQYFSSREHYDIKVVLRSMGEDGREKTALRSYSVLMLINDWIKYRLELEKKACGIWIKKYEYEIRKLEVFIKAISQIDYIIKLVRQKNPKLTLTELKDKVSKKLNITVEEATWVLDMPIKKLSALEHDEMLNKIKEFQQEIKGFTKRIKDPATYVTSHLDVISNKLI